MSAMLGTFDMPMSDYPNDDVLMHTHSSDPWAPQEDGIMEEDNITPFTALHKSSMMELNSTHTLSMSGDQMFYSETGPADLAIEVEMDDYTEDGNAEYEMLDDLNLIAEDVPEIQDVEVVDVQSSADSSLSEIPRPPQIAPVEAATIVSTTTHSESIDAAITSDSHSEPKEKNFESADGEAKSATSTHDNVGDATDTKPLPDDGPTASHKDSENVQHTHEVGQATPIVEDTLADGEPSQSEVPVPKASGSETVDSADTAHLGNFTPQTAEDTITVQATVEDHQEVELNSTENHEGEARTSTQQESVLQESEPPAPNPHEIAEGVYIEPPPGVLLNAWFTPNPCPLFNRPLPSGVATPQVEGDGTADILLHDRPTMFYEPLSSLFAALREEELFAKQEELQQVELVLAVETLQLSVSEDNIYSREISLHDIHLLHESFHTGPLRMELQHLSPRFITRYHELQDHLQRVGEDDVTDIASAVPESASEQLPGQSNVADCEETQAQDEQPSVEEHHPEHDSSGAEQRAVEEEEVYYDDATEVHHTTEALEITDSHYQHHADLDDESDVPTTFDAPAPLSTSSSFQPHQDEVVDVQTSGGLSQTEPSEGRHQNGGTVSVDHDEDREASGALDGAISALPSTSVDEVTAPHDELVDDLHEGLEGGDSAEDHNLEEITELDPEQQDAEDADELQAELEAATSDHTDEGAYKLAEEQAEQDELANDDCDTSTGEELEHSAGDNEEFDDELQFLEEQEDEQNDDTVHSGATESELLGEQLAQTQAEESTPQSGEDNSENIVDHTTLPDLPDDQDEDGFWDDDLDGEGEADPSWDPETLTTTSPNTNGKRAYDELDLDDVYDLGIRLTPSPDTKRTRLH